MYTFRHSVVTDFKEIQLLSKGIYNGFDTLSGEFYNLLEQPNCSIYVAIEKETNDLVGLTVLKLVDSGTTLISRFSRVRPDHQGKKLIKEINNFAILCEFKKPNAKIKYKKALCTKEIIEKNPHLLERAVSLGNTIHICYFLEMVSKEMVDESLSCITVNTSILNFKEFLQNCKQNFIIQQLLPDNIFNFNGDSFCLDKLSEMDIAFLRQKKIRIVYSTAKISTDNNDPSLHISSMHEKSSKEMLTAISLKPVMTNSGKQMFKFDTYGHNKELFKEHMYSVLQVIGKTLGDNQDEITVAHCFHWKENTLSTSNVFSDLIESVGYSAKIIQTWEMEWMQWPIS